MFFFKTFFILIETKNRVCLYRRNKKFTKKDKQIAKISKIASNCRQPRF